MQITTHEVDLSISVEVCSANFLQIYCVDLRSAVDVNLC